MKKGHKRSLHPQMGHENIHVGIKEAASPGGKPSAAAACRDTALSGKSITPKMHATMPSYK